MLWFNWAAAQHHSVTTVPEQQLPPGQLLTVPKVFSHDLICYGISLCECRSAALGLTPLPQLPLLVGQYDKLKYPLCSTAQQQLKHQCYQHCISPKAKTQHHIRQYETENPLLCPS